MLIVEDIIINLTEYLCRGEKEIQYKGIVFPVQETEYSLFTLGKMIRIGIEIPRYLNIEPNGGIHTTYEVTDGERSTYMSRLLACQKLANYFVKNILPKIDHQLNTIIHNENVEKILEVLD